MLISRLSEQVKHWKWHFSVFALLILCISCIRGPREPGDSIANGDGQTAADYRIVEVSGISVAESSGVHWKTPSLKTYDFRVCLTAKTTNAPLPVGQAFEISKSDGTIFDDKTDNLGCITWKERIPFNFLADSMYLEKVRQIKGKGSFQGTALAKIGINPWLEYRGEQGPEIVDLARRNVPERYLISEDLNGDITAGYLNESSGDKLLIEADLNFKVSKNIMLTDGHRVQMILKMKPFVEPLNMRGGRTRLALDTGKYRVRAQIVGDLIGKGQDKHVILSEIMPEEIDFVSNNTIVLDVTTDLKKRITTGSVRLALMVEAVDLPDPMSLKPYHGLHDIGDFEDITTAGTAVRIKGPNLKESFDYSSYIETASNFEELQKQGHAHSLPPVIYSRYDARFVRVMSGETATRRKIMYVVRTQVTNSLTGSAIARNKFNVKKANGEFVTPVPESGEHGFLEWNEEIDHLYYQPEQYFFPKTEVTHDISQAKHTVSLALNPWDWGWTFAVDLRTQKPTYKKLSADEVLPSRFIIDAFRYQTIRFRYVIDNYMTLNVKKAVVMTFDPLVQRSSIQMGRIKEPLRDGVYLMKVALVKYFIDPFQNSTRLQKDEKTEALKLVTTKDGGDARKGRYLTIIKKLVRVQGSRITTPMEFSMRDLRMMSIRSSLLVQIEAIDENRLMSTNKMAEKISELEDIYFNKYFDLSPGEREDFKDQQVQNYLDEAAKIAKDMGPELKKLDRQRVEIADKDFERFKLLRKLEKSNGEDREALEVKYDNLFRLTKPLFEKAMADARADLGTMQTDLNSYWGEWQNAYRENLLGDSSVGLLGRTSKEKDGIQANAAFQSDRMKRLNSASDSNLVNTLIKGGIPDGEITPEGEVVTVDEGNYLLPIPKENAYAARSVYDFLSLMNTFIQNSDIPMYLEENDVQSLEVNDYIAHPAAPFIDLDLYVNKKQIGIDDEGHPIYEYESGLDRRTFIGPCTLVENDNMSDMRPTDVIDEKFCDRIDCSEQIAHMVAEVDNTELENSRYQDSLKHFASMQVDHLLNLYIENEKWYQMRMNILSQLGNYTDIYNLDYVSLKEDEAFLMYKDNCTYVDKPEDCFVENTKDRIFSEPFISQLNEDSVQELLRRYFYVYSPASLRKAHSAGARSNSLITLKEKLISETGSLLKTVRKKISNIVLGPYRSLEDERMLHHHINDDTVGIPEEGSRIGYGIDAENLLSDYPERAPKTFTKKALKNFLDHGANGLSLPNALRICRFLAKRTIENLSSNPEGSLISEFDSKDEANNPISYLTHHCFQQIAYSPEDGSIALMGLAIDRRYRIIESGPYQHVSGTNMNIQVGSGFAIAKADERSRASSLGVSNSGLVGSLFTGVGSLAGAIKGAATGSKMGGLVGAGAGAIVGGMVTNTISGGTGVESAQAQMISNSSSVEKATFLVVQKADMDILLHKYEKCFTVKMTAEAISKVEPEKLNLKNPEIFKADEFSKDPVQLALSRGLMVCSGETTEYKKLDDKVEDEKLKKEHTIRESFYYVSQHFTAGQMLDDANLLNHIWLLALRGHGDFKTFTRLVEKRDVDRNGEVIQKGENSDYPLSRLSKVYDEVIPSFPGVYSVPN